jgi:hypothetical protein
VKSLSQVGELIADGRVVAAVPERRWSGRMAAGGIGVHTATCRGRMVTVQSAGVPWTSAVSPLADS